MKRLLIAFGLLLGFSGLVRAANPVRYVQISTNNLSQQSGAFHVSSGTVVTANITTSTILTSVVIPNGTEGSPSIKFNSSPQTGMFLGGINTIGFSAGGSASLYISSATQVSVYPGADNSFTLGTNAVGWKNIFANNGTSAAPAYTFRTFPAMGFFANSATSLGLSANGIVVASFTSSGCSFLGTTTNDSANSGWIGEYISSQTLAGTAVLATGSNQYVDVASITITAGDWDLNYVAVSVANGATVTDFITGVGDTVGNSSSGVVEGNTGADGPPPTSSYDSTQSLSGIRKLVTGPATYYLKVRLAYSAATPKSYGRLSARRMR